jgi:hypothetical protein
MRVGVLPSPTADEGDLMKHLFTLVALTAAMAAAPSFAADDAAKPRSAQQNKMATCNAEAKGKTGDERKAFMKECLSAKADGGSAQQEKMKKCNAEAKGKAGDERKKFMSSCLSAA